MKPLLHISLLLISVNCFGQINPENASEKNSISLKIGIGYSSVRHEYFDNDKYSGLLVPKQIVWKHQGVKNSWQVYGMLNTGNLKITYDDADIKNISLGFDFHVPINKFSILNNDAYLFIGPSTFIFTNIRKQNQIYLNDSNIIVGLWCIGPNIGIQGNLLTKLYYSTSLKISFLSYGGHDRISHSFLFINKAIHWNYNFSLNWLFHPRFYIGINYLFNYANIYKWDDFVTGSDNLLFSLNFKW